MKADEVRLYALRGGLKKQSVCYTHFHSNKVLEVTLYKSCTKSVRVPVFRGYQKPLHYSLHVPEEADVEAAKALDIMLLQKPAEQEKNISGKQKSRPEPEAAVYRVVKCR